MNHATTEVFFYRHAGCRRKPDRRGGKGFRYILSGMNDERILIASESVGDQMFHCESHLDL